MKFAVWVVIRRNLYRCHWLGIYYYTEIFMPYAWRCPPLWRNSWWRRDMDTLSSLHDLCYTLIVFLLIRRGHCLICGALTLMQRHPDLGNLEFKGTQILQSIWSLLKLQYYIWIIIMFHVAVTSRYIKGICRNHVCRETGTNVPLPLRVRFISKLLQSLCHSNVRILFAIDMKR